MKIDIIQAPLYSLPKAQINIIIDVIRAFTVAYYAFQKGTKQILMVRDLNEAFAIKTKNPNYLLCGEIKGLPIRGFDFDNSPTNIVNCNLNGKTLVQKTTNGVRMVLNNMRADHIFATGFSIARTTANYVKQLAQNIEDPLIHIIASHPTSDDDFACAEYIRDIIEEKNRLTCNQIIDRIKSSEVAQKFFNPTKPEFLEKDIEFCTREINSSFVIKLDSTKPIPALYKVIL